MDIKQFLSTVWPSVGPYLIAIPVKWIDEAGEPQSGFRHFPHETIDAAAEHAMALSWDNQTPQETYFALGSIIEVRKKGVRLATNISSLRCYWVDLDIGASEQKYATRTEAMVGLKKFCQDAHLPVPYVVSSGGGFHVYWALTEDVDRITWIRTASALKALARALGLRQDPTRTADCASVLRPVGTANWKTGEARPVKCIKEGTAVSQDTFAQLVAFAIESSGVTVVEKNLPTLIPGVAPTKGSAINAEAAADISSTPPPSNPKRVITRCKQLGWQLTNPTEVSEPSWYDAIGCLRHCVNGVKAVHRLSSSYPAYTESGTNNKIAHHEEGGYGPTLCATFEDHNPGGCDGCPHKGNIRSPIVLGYTLERVDAPEAKVVTAAGELAIDLPDPPYPFVRVKHPGTGAVQIAVETPGNDGAVDTRVIYDNDLYPSEISYDERENKYKAKMRRHLPKDGWGDFEFPLGDLFDRRGLGKLLGNIGVLPDSSNMEPLVQYMIGYIRQLQSLAAASVVYAQLGWRDAHQYFILPNKVVGKDGIRDVTPSLGVDNALAWSKHPPKGTLEAWKDCVSTYERPGMEGHLFAFGVGFAAPLLQFTNFAGLVISVVGTSGCGKSTAALCANSIWGHCRLGWADIENDTIKAFYNKLGVLRHLPVTYDEITNLDPITVSNMCYAVSKGQGRQRLEQDGTAKANYGDWQTIMLTTSNSSLHSKLSGAKADATAESARVFEYYIPGGTMTKEEADTKFNPIHENYGLAGPIYAQGMVEHAEWVKARVAYWGKTIDAETGAASSERYWSAGAACVFAGFELANKLQLTNVDLRRLLEFVKVCFTRMRTTVLENTKTPITALTDYLNSNLRNTLIVASMPNNGTIGIVTHMPTGELRVRYEAWNQRLFIDRTHFRKYCTDCRMDVQHVRRVLMESGVLLGDSARVVLGKGTALKTGQTHVWTIDMSHPIMGENAATLVQKVEPEVASAKA